MSREATRKFAIQLRRGDQVRVMVGKDAGKSGRILSVDPRKNTVVVEHANIIKRHTRPNPSKNIKGGIVEKEGPIHASNVMMVCSNCNKPSRIGVNVQPDGTRVRVCRRCGTAVD